MVKNKNAALIVSVIVVMDQLLKFFIRKYVIDIEVIKDFFSITFIKNTGAGFGILKGYTTLLIIVNVLALIFLFYVYIKSKKSYLANISMVLIIAGAIGNLIDRLFFGYVTDFVNFTFWPAFNLADISVSIGALILAYCLLSDKYE